MLSALESALLVVVGLSRTTLLAEVGGSQRVQCLSAQLLLKHNLRALRTISVGNHLRHLKMNSGTFTLARLGTVHLCIAL